MSSQSPYSAIWNAQSQMMPNARKPADPRDQAQIWAANNARQAKNNGPLPLTDSAIPLAETFVQLPDKAQYPIYNPYMTEPAYF